MKTLTLLCIAALALAAHRGSAQVSDTAGVPPDTTVRRDLPRLEIPEITIVGKKAITLPFARKGELYDVPLYDAPPPDSGLIADRPPIALPPGTLPRYEQREQPWRASLEGTAGRYGTYGFLGYVDYHTQRWNLSTTGGYSRTGGHVSNSEGSEYRVGGRLSSLVATDNSFLKSFRLDGDLEFRHDEFGMFGLLPAGAERDRNLYAIGAGFSSVRREGLVMDFRVAADILSVDDRAAGGADTGITVTSPILDASVTGDVGAFRLITGFRYAGSTADYSSGAGSPSLYTMTGALQWTLVSGIFLKAGGEYARGSGTDDVSRTRFSPIAELEWQIDEGRKFNAWLRPGMTLATYADLARRIPYIGREIALIPETKTVAFGGTIWYNSGMLVLQLGGEYSRSDNRPVLVTDSGRIRTEFAGTWQSAVTAEGTVNPRDGVRIRFNGAIRPSRERGSSTQLPMTPIGDGGAQVEYDVAGLWTLSAGGRYWTKQNVDRAGTASIKGTMLLDAGVSTTLIPQVLLSAGVRNILDREYQWWAGYPARGADFYVTAKARF